MKKVVRRVAPSSSHKKSSNAELPRVVRITIVVTPSVHIYLVVTSSCAAEW